jgi:hypothetical protein
MIPRSSDCAHLPARHNIALLKQERIHHNVQSNTHVGTVLNHDRHAKHDRGKKHEQARVASSLPEFSARLSADLSPSPYSDNAPVG